MHNHSITALGLGAGGRVKLAAGLALVLAMIGMTTPGRAQQSIIPYRTVDYPLHSGMHDGSGDNEQVAFSATVAVPDAPWLRLLFGSYDLGGRSYVTMRAADNDASEDDGWQILDARRMRQWEGGSAVFRGHAVTLELHVAPGDRGVFVELKAVVAGEREGPGGRTLCGNDDRVASSDNRVGRLFFGGCTAWRTTNGAFLTAGHCLVLSGVVEFNVPASTPNGAPVPASPNDQYPIDTSSVVWQSAGLGGDWAVFRVQPNSQTDLLPHEAYGLAFRMTREAPFDGYPFMRVTGFGTDNTPPGPGGGANAQNYTNQTATGPYMGEAVSGAYFWHEYGVDTMGGNSGSPIIWVGANNEELTIGIHTTGNCDNSGNGNKGTSFEVDALEEALQAFPGFGALYVDGGHPLPVSEDGTIFRPFDTVTEGVSAVSTGGIVSVVAGTYAVPSGFRIDRRMRLEAPAGWVVIDPSAVAPRAAMAWR